MPLTERVVSNSEPVRLGLDDDQAMADVVRAVGERAGFAVMVTTSDCFKEPLRLL